MVLCVCIKKLLYGGRKGRIINVVKKIIIAYKLFQNHIIKFFIKHFILQTKFSFCDIFAHPSNLYTWKNNLQTTKI